MPEDGQFVMPKCPDGAKLIRLGRKDVFAIVDEADYELLSQWTWHLHHDTYAYRLVPIGGFTRSGLPRKTSVMMHRFLMETPAGMDTDHINRNGLDNRRSNLRITDRTQNNFNSGIHINNTSGHRGVSWNKYAKSWRAYIGGSKGRVELGHFRNIEDAIAARLAAEEQYIDQCA